jgi:hypothetical protein
LGGHSRGSRLIRRHVDAAAGKNLFPTNNSLNELKDTKGRNPPQKSPYSTELEKTAAINMTREIPHYRRIRFAVNFLLDESLNGKLTQTHLLEPIHHGKVPPFCFDTKTCELLEKRHPFTLPDYRIHAELPDEFINQSGTDK